MKNHLMHYHSDLASFGLSGKRCANNVLTASPSEVLLSDNLRHLDLMSPTAGPPITNDINNQNIYLLGKLPSIKPQLVERIKENPSCCKLGNYMNLSCINVQCLITKDHYFLDLPSTRTISAVLPPSSETGRT